MRWDCHSCTLCCRLFALGPVDPAIVAGLEARDVGADWAPAAEGWYHETPAGLFLDHRDDSCVFLRSDGLCAVHALYGPEAKPAFCRTFPFTVVDQPGGVVHAVREDCGGGWQAQAAGTPMSEHTDALPSDAPRLTFGENPVLVLPGVGVDPQDWLALEAQLIAAIDLDADPRENLRQIRDATLRALRREPPPPDPPRAALATEHLRQACLSALPTGDASEGSSRYAERFMTRVRSGLTEAAASGPEELPSPTKQYLAQVLIQHLRGKAFLSTGGVCWGLGLYALGTELARARAPSGALEELAPWHVQWSRFTRNRAAISLLHQGRDLLWEGVLYR